MPFRVVHYLNQFFAGLGGEAQADLPPRADPGPRGPGLALRAALGERAAVVATVICGDSYAAEHADEALAELLPLVASFQPDVLVAGPAFGSGRYGLACSALCAAVQRRLGLPAVTAMHADNPGVALYRRQVVVVPTSQHAAGMRDALARIAPLVLRLAAGEPLGPAAVEGYLPRGVRQNVRTDRPAPERAVEMLLAKLAGQPFTTEVPLPSYERVPPPPPVADLRQAVLLVATEGGLVPRGNPDRLEWVRATKWLRYPLDRQAALAPGDYEISHGGYDTSFATADPNCIVPLDALREAKRA
ncbi:MAG: glycine/betaine/sarcosine/D-proline family reductase selenoprotein B, partial [Chloroflexi bacterium]|nr:glycine/betaine/sarcosine/D-proline family reductase selenoprotein B [Chloroflexota bacterium]